MASQWVVSWIIWTTAQSVLPLKLVAPYSE
jgi:hypothetical protein